MLQIGRRVRTVTVRELAMSARRAFHILWIFRAIDNGSRPHCDSDISRNFKRRFGIVLWRLADAIDDSGNDMSRHNE